MRKSLEEFLDIRLIDSHFLWCLSNPLADCSDAECFLTGEIVNSLADKSFSSAKSGWTEVQLRKQKIFFWTEEKTIDRWPDPTRTELRPQLESGLKLKWLGNSLYSYYLRSESQSELKLIYIWRDEANLVEKVGELGGFEQVEWLWIGGSSDVVQLKFAFEQIKRLPKCRNCRITDGSAASFHICLWLGRKSEFPVNSGHSGVNPEFIYFQVGRSLGEKILRKFSSLRQSDSGEVEIESIEEYSDGGDLRLAVNSSSWSVWDFLQCEADWSRSVKPNRCCLC